MLLERRPVLRRGILLALLVALGAGCQFIAAVDRSKYAKEFDDEGLDDEVDATVEPDPVDPDAAESDATVDASEPDADPGDADAGEEPDADAGDGEADSGDGDAGEEPDAAGEP